MSVSGPSDLEYKWLERLEVWYCSETNLKPSTSRVETASRRFKFTRDLSRSLLPHGVSMGCPPLLKRPSALQDVCARTHDIGSHLVSLYDPAHHLAGVGSFVDTSAFYGAFDTSAVAAQSPGRAARSARSAPSRAQVCGCLQPCLGH